MFGLTGNIPSSHAQCSRDCRIKIDDQRLLAGIYCRADKELAPLTTHDEATFNASNALIDGINLVESLLRLNLYVKVGRQLPPVTTGSSETGYGGDGTLKPY